MSCVISAHRPSPAMVDVSMDLRTKDDGLWLGFIKIYFLCRHWEVKNECSILAQNSTKNFAEPHFCVRKAQTVNYSLFFILLEESSVQIWPKDQDVGPILIQRHLLADRLRLRSQDNHRDLWSTGKGYVISAIAQCAISIWGYPMPSDAISIL